MGRGSDAGSEDFVSARSYRFVPVVVDVLDKEPNEDFDAWQHVVEAGLDVRSGRLVVYGPAQDVVAPRGSALLPAPAGVRVSSWGLRTVPPNGLTGISP